MRGTKALGALLLLCPVAMTQHATRNPQSVVADLGSDDDRTVAVAAQRAREHPDRSFARPAAEALARWRAADGEHARLVCLHLLDALIALDARVPASELAALVDDATCGTAAFVLLAREPRHHEPELLALFRRDWPAFDASLESAKDLRTLALGNLLAPQASPGFVPLLLPGLDVDVRIEVLDRTATAGVEPPPVMRAGGAGARGAARALAGRGAAPDGRLATPAGWPATPLYEFESPRLRSERPLVRLPAAADVPIVRATAAAGELHVVRPGLAAGHEPPPPALRWLAAAAGLAVPSAPRRMPFAGADELADLAARSLRQRQVFVGALRRELLARNAMTEADAKVLEGRVALRVDDARQDRSVPLPALPAQPGDAR